MSCPYYNNRSDSYHCLANQRRIIPQICQYGMFNLERLYTVIAASTKYQLTR
jgi:hypothetical protein